MGENQGVQPDWIILADAAQVVDGKLYLLGGGWDRLIVNNPFPIQHSCAIAVSFQVPWNETNAPHQFEVELVDEDGRTLLQAGGHLEVGRPVGLPPGQPQRVQFAVNALLTFEKAGSYLITVRIEGQDVDRATFWVTPGPLLAAKLKRAS